MLLTFITATLVASCPTVQKTAETGVTWTQQEEKLVLPAAEAGCRARGFECVLEVHKFGQDQFGVKCSQKEN